MIQGSISEGKSHGAQVFGLVIASNGAAVVVGQQAHRAALELGMEEAFAGGVKIGAANEDKYWDAEYYMGKHHNKWGLVGASGYVKSGPSATWNVSAAYSTSMTLK